MSINECVRSSVVCTLSLPWASNLSPLDHAAVSRMRLWKVVEFAEHDDRCRVISSSELRCRQHENNFRNRRTHDAECSVSSGHQSWHPLVLQQRWTKFPWEI